MMSFLSAIGFVLGQEEPELYCEKAALITPKDARDLSAYAATLILCCLSLTLTHQP